MTKKQKHQRQVELAEIEMRLCDMAQGAVAHSAIDQDEAGLCFGMGLAEWLGFVGAVQKTFQESGFNSAPAQSIAFELWNLHHFDSFEDAAEFLHRMGARP